MMAVRLTRRSGRAVKPGRGGFALLLFWGRPVLMYTDPETGNGSSVEGWRLLRARRECLKRVALLNLRPAVEPEPADPRHDPYERALPMPVQVSAEDTINSMFGLPPVWRCPCGGRPFVTEATCPRCGRTIDHDWTDRAGELDDPRQS